jgi:hypothetical protein
MRSLRKGAVASLPSERGMLDKKDVMVAGRWRNVGAAARKGKGACNGLGEQTVLAAEGTAARGGERADNIPLSFGFTF